MSEWIKERTKNQELSWLGTVHLKKPKERVPKGELDVVWVGTETTDQFHIFTQYTSMIFEAK